MKRPEDIQGLRAREEGTSWSHALGRAMQAGRDVGRRLVAEKSLSPLYQLVPSHPEQSKCLCGLSGLHAGSPCSCWPQRLLSPGPVPLAEHLPWSMAVTLLPLKAKGPLLTSRPSLAAAQMTPSPARCATHHSSPPQPGSSGP